MIFLTFIYSSYLYDIIIQKKVMKIKVCLIQDYPIFFDKEKTLEKIEDLTRKYAVEGGNLIVFPESFIPGYPGGFSFGTVIGSRSNEGKRLYSEYHENSFCIRSNDMNILRVLKKIIHENFTDQKQLIEKINLIENQLFLARINIQK